MERTAYYAEATKAEESPRSGGLFRKLGEFYFAEFYFGSFRL